jgi:HCOMODA/2-hydroxy-3-carboxy-muconic semialdehyde decarboxylase
MRGNGAIVVSDSLEKAVTLSWFLEDAARVEQNVRAMGFDPSCGLLDAKEISSRQVWSGGVVDRMWRWMNRDI